ncbi:MAG: hypothetical protein IPM97_05525 [Bdellovibrionaceae bacterium]|nr:hypothetical protein [Pseudobdellovibrionaceae bacterium]
MRKYSLTKAILQTKWIGDGLIEHSDGTILKSFEMEPLSLGLFEEGLDGPSSDGFFQKLSELLTRLPNFFEGQIILFRSQLRSEIKGLKTTILVFEKVKKEESYSHFQALLGELKLHPVPLGETTWKSYVSSMFGKKVHANSLPDVVWEKDCLRVGNDTLHVLSLTELPQVTWKGCLQPLLKVRCLSRFRSSLIFQIEKRSGASLKQSAESVMPCPSQTPWRSKTSNLIRC